MKLVWPEGSSSLEAVAVCRDHFGAQPEPSVVGADTRTGPDPVAIAALVLGLPSALLASWDLTERMQLVPRVAAWLAALRALPGAATAHLEFSSGPRPLMELSPGEVLDEAKRAELANSGDDTGWDAFIIYSSVDLEAARTLWETLIRHNIPTFFDKRSLRPGDDGPRRSLEVLNRAQVFVVIVGPESAKGWNNPDALARAVKLVGEDPKRTLVPILVEGATTDRLPPGLAHLVPAHPEEVVEVVRARLGVPGRGRS